MSEPVTPTVWHTGSSIAQNGAGQFLICPECGEYVARALPIRWTPAWGPAPGFCHLADGQPLCPLISTGDGVVGYVPANPVSRADFDDANGCPCDTVYWCQCSCTCCFCRDSGIAPADQVAAHGVDTRGGVIPRG